MTDLPEEFFMGLDEDSPADVVEDQDLPEFDESLIEGEEFDDEVS